MKIDRAILYECDIRVDYKATYTSGQKDPPAIPVFFLEIRADGISGFGECIPYYPWEWMGHDERQTLLNMCQLLIGQNPLALGHLIPDSIRRPHLYTDPDRVVWVDQPKIKLDNKPPQDPHGRIFRRIGDTNNLVDAVEFALYDLIGKAFGIPVSTMLGGTWKPFVWGMPVLYTDDPKMMSEKAEEWYRRYGFRYYKLKPNGNTEDDEETLRRIRERTSPEVKVFQDPNRSLKMSADETVKYLNHLADFGLAMCEDPIDADLQTYAEIRRRSKVPIMIDMGSRTEQAVLNIVNAKAADAINIHADHAGGLQAALRRANLADTGGVQAMIGSTHYLGAGSAAYQILASILPGEMPCEQVNAEVYGAKSIVRDPFEISDGRIIIADRPGLGVEPDMEKLSERCLQKHEIE